MEAEQGPLTNRRDDWLDPRTRVTADSIVGATCEKCGRSTVLKHDRCLACGTLLVPKDLGNTGSVWASTVVHVPVGHRQPPFTLAYLDLAEGARLLCHVVDDGGRPGAFANVAIGDELRITGVDEDGNPTATLQQSPAPTNGSFR